MPHAPASRHTATSLSSSFSRREARRHRKSRSQKNLQQNSQGNSQRKSQRNLQRTPPKKSQRQQPSRSQDQHKEHQRKVLWAGGAITLLAMATILPTQVSSQAIADNKCERVIRSGAEVSRSQLSSVLSIPEGSTKQSIQQVIAEPYCALPALSFSATSQDVSQAKKADESADKNDAKTQLEDELMLEREAYPLAFDPEAWLVVTYHSGEYQGYDFVFHP